MFSRVLVPLDQSLLAEQALGTAAAIAQSADGEIMLVLAREPSAYDALLDLRHEPKDRDELLYIRGTAEKLSIGSGVTTNGTVESGPPVDVICRRAWELDADLIVMTSHGRTGLGRAWLGSVADGVIRKTSVPVLMLRAGHDPSLGFESTHAFQRILVPLDGSGTSATILEWAVAFARCFNAALVLLRVVLPVPLYIFEGRRPVCPSDVADMESTHQLADDARRELTALAQRIERDHTTRVATEVKIAGDAAATIIAVAKSYEADLIAMATRGRGVARLAGGSVTDGVMRGTDLPLLLYHPRAIADRAEWAQSPAAHYQQHRREQSASGPFSTGA